MTSYIDEELKGRRFEVNGRPVFIRGGNWIVSDAMLRLSKERYQVEVSSSAAATHEGSRCRCSVSKRQSTGIPASSG
jgi:mannosylglycoprotein endo-beta-mannosidase